MRGAHQARQDRRLRPSERIRLARQLRELEAEGLSARQAALRLGVSTRLIVRMRAARRSGG